MLRNQAKFLKHTPFSSQRTTNLRSLRASSSKFMDHHKSQTQDTHSLNRIITSLSKSGDLSSARQLFDEMPQRDLVSWNSIMAAYAHNHHFDESLAIFSEMHRSGLTPSTTSLSTALASCARLRALDRGMQVHGLSVKLHASANVFVGTSLIAMYSKCNVVDGLCWVFDEIECASVAAWNALVSGYVWNRQIADARRVFDRMPERNVVSWTAMINGYVEVRKVRAALELFDSMPNKNCVTWCVMIGGLVADGKHEEAMDLFARMMCEGIRANGPSIVKVIGACSGMKSLNHGRKVHSYVVKLGLHLDQIVEAALVFMYCECLSIEEAKLEFERMESKFTGSWNSLINGYVNSNRVEEARILFDRMNARDKISWSLMVSGYLKSNMIDDALKLFSEMPEPTVEAVTALMYGFIGNGRVDEAQKLFDTLPQRDAMAYTTLVSGYLEEGQVERAMELFNEMPERNVVSFNVMIAGLFRHGKVTDAYELFNECPEKDSITWDTLLAGFIQNGFDEQAFALYREFLLTEICTSESIITSLLRSSSKLSSLILGEQLHAVSIKLALEQFLVVRNSLINMYCKCGGLYMANTIFNQMADRDVVTCNAMIYGYALHGLAKEAIETFRSMERTMVRPDDVTFLGVLYACNHGCFLDEAQHHFSSMRDYGVVPTLPHYACMVHLLCRMGMVEEAERLVSAMPFKPDSAIWTSLLSGCRLNANVELAEHAANQLFAWDAMDRMPYLHLMSVYGSAGRWDYVNKLRSQMNKLRPKKEPGCSWI